MLGNKAKNLMKLKNEGFNIPNFEIIKYEDDFSNIEKSINLSGEKFAVRSSSNIEDGTKDSFAGQFETYLNVNKAEIKEKIKMCFESLKNNNVFEYIKEKNINVKDLNMNVIIQEMVQAEYSGIIFSSNPQGILNESVIVVGKGLGENVVSDKVETTSYYYNNTDKVYYFEGKHDYLDKETIEELINIVEKAKKVIGKYLDIEFAIKNKKIYILQARNITTIDDSKICILDNSNIVESYPGLSTPLTISFVRDVYSKIFVGLCYRIVKNKKILSKNQEIFNNMVASSNGRIYYKINNWYNLLKFLPFNKRIIPIWQEMLGVKFKNYNDSKNNISIFNKIRTYINFFIEFFKSQKNMTKLNKKFDIINEEFYNKFNENMDEKEIWELYTRVEKEILAIWDITLLNDIYTFIFTGILKSLLKKKYSNYEEKLSEYISGISNIESLKPIHELISLAYKKESLNKETYKKNIEEYIKKYGDRNLEELKLESLTFRTNPELLERKIEEYRQEPEKLKELYKNINKEKVNVNIEKENFIVKYIIKKCMSGIKNREISRLNRSRIYGMVRKMFLQLGNIYKNQNCIENDRDIFYLTLDEIKELAIKKSEKQKVIMSRLNDYNMYKSLPTYSRLLFVNKEFDKTHKNINTHKFYKNDKKLRGTPCSNGIVRGQALIIENINDIKDIKDKILITKMTDPGWVFLIATAKGVISEKGSLLSHTAIISRELKIPSIVGVDNLLNTVKNGDLIEMNGTDGTITIIKEG